MKGVLIGLILFFGSELLSQSNIEWQRTFGGTNSDQAKSVKKTADGGYIVAGHTTSNDGDIIGYHGGLDVLIIKLDSVGLPQWKKVFGGSNNERPYAVQQTKDGGYIISGTSISVDGDVIGNHGEYDVWLLKLNEAGGIEWQKCYGGSDWDEAWDVQQTLDGGYIVAGNSGSNDGDILGNHGLFDYWVLKVDGIGELEWQKTYGGSGRDNAFAIKQTSDGGFIVTGESNSLDGMVTGNHGEVDYWVIKLNFEGKIEWEKSLGGSAADDARDILQTRDGGYIVFGQASSFNGDVTGQHGGLDFWVVKLDQTGNLEWQKAIGGNSEDNGFSLTQINDGGFVMIGMTQSTNRDVVGNEGGADLWLVKLSESGDFKWQKTFGGTQAEGGFSIQETNDLGYIAAGFAWSNNGDVTGVQGRNDFWVVKFSPESTPTTTSQTLPVEIFPNPATHTISINILFEASNLTICITDLLGREFSRQTLSNNVSGSIELPVAALPDGMYLINVQTGDGRIFTGKFTK